MIAGESRKERRAEEYSKAKGNAAKGSESPLKIGATRQLRPPSSGQIQVHW